MFNNEALAVVIGLVFIYLLYSLLGTLIQEIVATNIGLRGIILQWSIERMLGKDKSSCSDRPLSLSAAFFDHPLIRNLSTSSLIWAARPAYIENQVFSKVVTDLLRGTDLQAGMSSRSPIQAALEKGEVSNGQKNIRICPDALSYIRSLWVDAQGDVQKFQTALETWFAQMMGKTTGWYKRRTQYILFVVGLLIALIFNVDTIKITAKLQHDPKLREQVVAQANEFLKTHPNLEQELAATNRSIDSMTIPADKSNMKEAAMQQYQRTRDLRDSLVRQANDLVANDISKVNNLLSTGWEGGFRKNVDGWSFPGWLITALAISLGAPFWFDLLNKLMQLRGTVQKGKDTDPKDNNTDTLKIVRVG